jgi:hypothetical protein
MARQQREVWPSTTVMITLRKKEVLNRHVCSIVCIIRLTRLKLLGGIRQFLNMDLSWEQVCTPPSPQ